MLKIVGLTITLTKMDKQQKMEALRKKLLAMPQDEFNSMLDEGKEITQHQWNVKNAGYAKTDYLIFKPEKIRELAKPFKNPQQMVDFKGENQKLINAAGRYIEHDKAERPEWFDKRYKGESLEECLEVARQYTNYVTFKEQEERIYQRIYWMIGYDEMRNILKQWMTGFTTEYTDDVIISILKQYKTISELRKVKEHKKYITKLQVEGDKFPKAYALYKTMMSKPGNKKGLKRGNYEQRTPAIEKYDLKNNLLKTYETWQDVINDGFNRNSVAGAIRGTDGHHKHKNFIWKHKIGS